MTQVHTVKYSQFARLAKPLAELCATFLWPVDSLANKTKYFWKSFEIKPTSQKISQGCCDVFLKNTCASTQSVSVCDWTVPWRSLEVCALLVFNWFLFWLTGADSSTGSPTEAKFRAELKKLHQQYPDHILWMPFLLMNFLTFFTLDFCLFVLRPSLGFH